MRLSESGYCRNTRGSYHQLVNFTVRADALVTHFVCRACGREVLHWRLDGGEAHEASAGNGGRKDIENAARRVLRSRSAADLGTAPGQNRAVERDRSGSDRQAQEGWARQNTPPTPTRERPRAAVSRIYGSTHCPALMRSVDESPSRSSAWRENHQLERSWPNSRPATRARGRAQICSWHEQPSGRRIYRHGAGAYNGPD